jgi:hypothetical protein
MDAKGTVLSVDQIDGATIRPLLDRRGRIPRPPVPGYMQTIKGRSWQWFTADRLLYRPYNTSASTPYGKSPIEFLILRINEGLRRQLVATEYWAQTNVPEAMAFLPKEWSPENIRTFQDYFDNLLVGDIARLRRIKFMPSPGGTPIYEFRRPDAGSAALFDEWLLKMTCWAFGFLPSELGLTGGQGLGGKGFMEGMENAQYRFGIGPIVSYLQNLFTSVLRRQTTAPLVWRFKDLGPIEDKQADAALMQMQMQNGIIDINVWRQKAGQPPIEGAEPFLMLPTGPVLVRTLFAMLNTPLPSAPVPAPQEAPPAEPARPGDGARAAPSPVDEGKASAPITESAPHQAAQPQVQPSPDRTTPARPVPNAAQRVPPIVEKAVALAGDGWTPPEAVQRAARLGLELREKFGRGGTAVGVARARDLSHGRRIPPATVYRMLSYFARHAVDAQADGWEDIENPSAGWVAWLLWGGDPGRDWVQSLERRYEKALESAPVGPEPTPLSAYERMALDHWREKAIRRLKDGKKADCDPPTASAPVLSSELMATVRRGLALAGDVAMVQLVFKAIADPKAFARPQEAHERVRERADGRVHGRVNAHTHGRVDPRAHGRAHGRAHEHAYSADGRRLSKAWDLSAMEERLFDALSGIFADALDTFAEWVYQGDPWQIGLEDLSDEVQDELRPVLQDIAEDSILGAEEAVGYALGEPIVSSAASEWARSHVGQLVRGIDETTREAVGGVIADYLTEPGVTLEELVEDLRPTFGDVRAETIAVTETTRASAAGQRLYQQRAADMGVRTLRKNNTNHDDLVCPICAPLNQATEDEWPEPDGPPWHPRCRCFVTLQVVVPPLRDPHESRTITIYVGDLAAEEQEEGGEE